MVKLAPCRLHGRFTDPFRSKSSVFGQVGCIFCLGGRFWMAFLRRKPVKIDENPPFFKNCVKWSGFAPGRLRGRFTDPFRPKPSVFGQLGCTFCIGGRFWMAFLRRKTGQNWWKSTIFQKLRKMVRVRPGSAPGAFYRLFPPQTVGFWPGGVYILHWMYILNGVFKAKTSQNWRKSTIFQKLRKMVRVRPWSAPGAFYRPFPLQTVGFWPGGVYILPWRPILNDVFKAKTCRFWLVLALKTSLKIGIRGKIYTPPGQKPTVWSGKGR